MNVIMLKNKDVLLQYILHKRMWYNDKITSLYLFIYKVVYLSCHSWWNDFDGSLGIALGEAS